MRKKILGIGNALVDIMTILNDDKLLEKFGLRKGSMQLVDKHFSMHILDLTNNLIRSQSSGGSAANTINGLANLGIQTGFIGKIGTDDLGTFFREEMKKHSIEAILYESSSTSGHAIALVSPDYERTFATYLGAAIELSADDLNPNIFKEYEYLHIEGYLVQNHELLEKALKLAKDNKMIVSLDLASYNIVNENIDFLKSMIEKYVDIVFANEEEAKAFTGKEPDEAVNDIARHCEFAIVKKGNKGSIIKKGENIYYIGIIPAKLLDTTGAGDLYASGFLYGLVNNLPLDKCGILGSLVAGKVVEVIGAKIDSQRWKDIYETLHKII
ncbi:MAG TPA: adenosine kinase [Bacteroidales bacterium]|nr:adenosine kinase [Bacteroidales bacterium]